MGAGTALGSVFPIIAAAAGVAPTAVKALKAKSFSCGLGFALGLIFRGPILMLILGFGCSEYIGNTTA